MSTETVSTGPNFRYWNQVDPCQFLAHDWENPSREWAAGKAIEFTGDGLLLEVGPGPGVDYERYFKGVVSYCGFEGSANLWHSLCARFPETAWHQLTIDDLRPLSADVVYARHVMEHQPALEPALGQMLGAARHVVVLTWYRPPAEKAFGEVWEGVHCQTFARAEVMAAVERAGFGLLESEAFESGDETWVLLRV